MSKAEELALLRRALVDAQRHADNLASLCLEEALAKHPGAIMPPPRDLPQLYFSANAVRTAIPEWSRSLRHAEKADAVGEEGPGDGTNT